MVTFPFIERKMRLGLVESILQLGDATPTIAAYYSSFLDGLLLRLLMLLMKLLNVLFLESDFGFWRCVLWLFLLLLLMMIVVMLLIVVTPIIAVPEVLLPDVVLVEIDFVLVVVFFVFVVLLVRRDVPILRVAAVLRADRPRGRFVVELLGVAALLLLLLIRRRVRDQLRRTELDDGGGIRGGGTQ